MFSVDGLSGSFKKYLIQICLFNYRFKCSILNLPHGIHSCKGLPKCHEEKVYIYFYFNSSPESIHFENYLHSYSYIPKKKKRLSKCKMEICQADNK